MAKFYTQKLITTYHCEFAGLGLPRGLLVELRGRAETIMERKGTKREKHGGIKWPPLSITAQLLYMESLKPCGLLPVVKERSLSTGAE